MNYGESSEEPPLLRYFEDCERASFIDDDNNDNNDNNIDTIPRKKVQEKGKKATRKPRSLHIQLLDKCVSGRALLESEIMLQPN
jgi:hypothetical protein